MRLVPCLLLLAAQAAYAACPINLNLESVGSPDDAYSVWWTFETDTVGASTKARMEYGPASVAYRSREIAGMGVAAARNYTITGLDDSTAYWFDPQVTDVAGTVWSDYTQCQAELCPDGDGAQAGKNYSCADAGGGNFIPTATTAADTVSYPIAPIAPSGLPTDPTSNPTVTGTTLSVTTNLQAQIDACETAAEADGLLHEVVLPALSMPENEALEAYTLPALTQGSCWIRCGIADDQLPPAGAHFGQHYYAEACEITFNTTFPIGTQSLLDATAANGWRVGPGIRIRTPRPSEITEARQQITGFNHTTGEITTAVAHGLTVNERIEIELPGVEHDDAHGACHVWTPITATTFTCLAMQGATGGTFGGTGWWTSDPSRVATSCTAGGLCTTTNAHPWGDFHDYGVVSFSGTTLQLDDSTLLLREGASLQVSGCGGNDGVYGIASVAGDTVTTSAAAPGSCSSGTAQQLHAVYLGDTDTDAVDRTYLATFPSETTVQLVTPALPGATVGGWLSRDPPLPVVSPLVQLLNSSDMVLDRVSIESYRPWRFHVAIDVDGSTSNAIAGVSGLGFSPWWAIDPETGRGDALTGNAVFSSPGVFLQIGQDVSQLLAARSTFNGNGWFAFADAFVGAPPADVRFAAIEAYSPSPRLQDTGRGLARLVRNMVEFKLAERVEVEGVVLDGGGAVGTPQGESFFLSAATDADDQEIEDIALRDFYIQGPTCIGISEQWAGHQYRKGPLRRIEVDNGVCDSDWFAKVGQPGGQALEIPTGYSVNGFGGAALRIEGGSSVKVSRLTAKSRGRFGQALWPNGRRYHALQVFNSIFIASEWPPQSGIVEAGTGAWSQYLPTISTTDGYPMWSDLMERPPGTLDPDTLFDVKIVPGSANSESATWLTDSNSVRAALVADADCGGACPSQWSVEISGSDPDTAANRIAEQFEADSWERKSGVWPGYGHDHAELEDALYRVRDLSTSGIAGGVRLSYTAPAAATCWAQATDATKTVNSVELPDWSGALSWVTDSSGLASRTTDVTGLTADQVYWLRLTCGLQTLLAKERAL